MSSSSLYEPDEDDDTSDSDISIVNSNPPTTTQTRRYRKGLTRAEALDELYLSLPQPSIEAYTSLFAKFETDIITAPPTSKSRNWETTQHGAVIWTPREKETLLRTLDRTGNNGVREIARTIETKSELEVREFLRLLHRAVEHHHLRGLHAQGIILGDVPAAAETSKTGCEMLDEYGKLLSFAEKQSEDVAGHRKHHDFWIVDQEKAEEVDELLASPEDHSGTDSSIIHTARLLNLKRWVRLSERFFMNFGGPRLDDNWANVAFADEMPSVTVDAFADFYALTLSVTRRLVHSALFFAMSRLRNMRETGNPKAQIVRSRDVYAAVNVLNMKRNRVDYWVGLARRCSLDVADVRHRVGWKPIPLNHDEVEEILSGEMPFDSEPGTRSVSRRRSRSQTEEGIAGEYTDHASESESEPGSEGLMLSSPLVSSAADDGEAPPSDLSDASDGEDRHAEQVDQQASRRDERQLYHLLGRTAPASLDPDMKHEDEQEAKLGRPIGARKTKEDLVHWRDRTVYRSEWEEYGHEIFDFSQDISTDRRKRRRLTSYDVTDEETESVFGETHTEADQALEVGGEQEEEQQQEEEAAKATQVSEVEDEEIDEEEVEGEEMDEEEVKGEEMDEEEVKGEEIDEEEEAHLASEVENDDLEDGDDDADHADHHDNGYEEMDLDESDPELAPEPKENSDVESNKSFASQFDSEDSGHSPPPRGRKTKASNVNSQGIHDEQPPTSSSDDLPPGNPENQVVRRSGRFRRPSG
ncbi:hypothetical protein FE257_004649 [Aspergillus nanangensis]|uniref:Myb-like domain-containing protein n=1 Tax=Aspergillus nanangensis TaxID=2582783 RepID=A0AAD4D0D0_ASPNN|nr:hypothetical protein FE257_004649 [Aspergillus nanangensis]